MKQILRTVLPAGLILLAVLAAGCGAPSRPPRKQPAQDAGFHYRWAQEQYNRGRYMEALESIDKAIDIEPDDYTNYYMRAHIYLAAGETEKSIADLARVLEINPYFTDARNTMGVAYATLGDTASALAAFDAALDDPKYPFKQKVYYNRGDLYFNQEDFPKAIEEFRRALTVEPDYARAHFKLGKALQATGRAEEANREFDEVLRLVPPRSELAREVHLLRQSAAAPSS
ncbi:MAG: tetratricopeptide repeat protein [Acidobacteriota bacterium]